MCNRPPAKVRLAVDHDHETGLIRGLLCWRCNSALMKFGDNPRLMENAASYIRWPHATTALGFESFGRVGRVTNKRKKRPRRKS